ncbi:MAG: molecular chaperone TorD family protein [Burkholderiales bacterium]|nr:molecular chaperone TorD family protein [Burkholderiales bacterium]
MGSVSNLKLGQHVNEAEAARADLYGLLAALFYSPPSEILLAVLAAAQMDGENALDAAWNAFVQCAASTSAAAVHEEFLELFVDRDQQKLELRATYYLEPFLRIDEQLALRADLQLLDLPEGLLIAEVEDHIASLCEVMRYLISAEANLSLRQATQKKFFLAHMQTWVPQLCAAIRAHPRARLYASLAVLANVFFETEMQAFKLSKVVRQDAEP